MAEGLDAFGLRYYREQNWTQALDTIEPCRRGEAEPEDLSRNLIVA
jgi:hypothetical protein